jgi:heme-degrading monooxygenase HmoA
MVTEHVILPVRPGAEAAFEAAFAQAIPLISETPGFISLQLQRSIESPSSYLLLVGWHDVEDHTEVFRGSLNYERWRELLHRFYDPVPEVEHFELVASV